MTSSRHAVADGVRGGPPVHGDILVVSIAAWAAVACLVWTALIGTRRGLDRGEAAVAAAALSWPLAWLMIEEFPELAYWIARLFLA